MRAIREVFAYSRHVVVVAVVLGCGARGPAPAPPPADPTAQITAEFSAARWIPDRAAYAIAAKSVREAQSAVRDTLDSFGIVAGVSADDVAAQLARFLAVDPLSAEAVADIGVDLDGGIAVFSEGASPTFVVRLASPSAFRGFIARLGDVRASLQTVDGVEVVSVQVSPDVRVSWALVDDWLWVHFALPVGEDLGTTWFTSSRGAARRAAPPDWAADWGYARSSAGPKGRPIVGFVDLRGVISGLSSRIPGALACAQLLSPIERVAIAVDSDFQHASGTLAFEIGPSAAAIARALMPVPEGWAEVAGKAPIAAQWNLDAAVMRAALDPCARTLDIELDDFERFGVRSARVLLRSLDPDDRSGTGAVALDLAHKRALAGYLDDIPLRSTLERRRTFGPHAGYSLSIPTMFSLDYVLTDTLALAAVGDGLLTAIVGRGATVPGPVFSVDIMPGGLTPEAWAVILEVAGLPHSHATIERLRQWRDAHVAVTIDGSRLVLRAWGNRK